MPEGAVYVGRPTMFGNPFQVGDWVMFGDPHPNYRGIFSLTWCKTSDIFADHRYTHIETREQAVAFYRKMIEGSPLRNNATIGLRGKDLACWCPLDRPCHADVLLEIANREASHA
jgi:hypothetical protein